MSMGEQREHERAIDKLATISRTKIDALYATIASLREELRVCGQERSILTEVAAAYTTKHQAVKKERDRLLVENESMKKLICTYPEGLCSCPHFRGTP